VPVLDRLAADHRVLVPDLPGLGESAPMRKLDDAAFEAWFEQLLLVTKTVRPTLVAHSLLGTLAARFAARRSDMLGQLVIYAAPGIGAYRMPLALRHAAIRFALRPTARNAERFERYALLDLDATRARDRRWYAAFDAYTRSRAAVPHVKRTMRRLVSSGTKQIPEADLRRITAGTGLVWGRGDRMVPLRLAEDASARLGWPLEVVERVAHAPHLEQPEAFVHALSRIETIAAS
jgi:2-hydroxymuconate-semialdehyde hydrolase